MAGSRVLFTWFFLLLVLVFFLHFQYFLRHTCSDIFWVDMDSAKRFYLLSHVCFLVLLSESQRALRSQGRKPRIGGMHYDKGQKVFLFCFSHSIFTSVYKFGGGELSQKCDSPWLILLLNANCKCHVAMGEAGHLTFVSNLRGQFLWPKKYVHSRPLRKKAGHGDGVLGAAAA